jgi:hypothetical protein
MGALGLASPWVSFHDLWSARTVAPDDTAAAAEPRPPAELPRASVVAGASDDLDLAPEPRSTDDPVHAPDRP